MNEEDLQNIIVEHIHKAPKPVREYIVSDSFPRVLREIIANQRLHIDQAYDVEVQTILLLLGLKSPNEYVQELRNTGLKEHKAIAVAKEMNEKVMQPIFNAYKKPQSAAVNAFAEEVANEEPEEGSGAMREPETPVQAPVETPEEEKKIEKKYAIDPYREPIE